MAPQQIKMTFSLPVELAQALDQERLRLADELRTRLSVNQTVVRLLALGLEASANVRRLSVTRAARREGQPG